MAHSELAYKGYSGSVEPSIEDECIHGRVLFVDDLVTYEGQTMSEVRAAFEAAVDRYLAHCERTGKEPNKPYSGTFNVRIGPELHGKADRLARRKGVKLNEFVRQAVAAAVENDGTVRHLHQHQHQHDVTVKVSAEKQAVTGYAVPGQPGQEIWEKQSVRHH